MKNRTKLWIMMLLSVFGSFIVFFGVSFITGSIWNKGYDLNKLDSISLATLNSINELNSSNKADIQTILDHYHTLHPSIRFEWIHSDGTTIYDTSGINQVYDFQELAQRFLNMPERLWASEDTTISFSYSSIINNNTFYLLISLPSEAMKQGQTYFFVRTFEVLVILILPLLLSFMVPYFLSIQFFSSINRRINRLNNALNQVNLQSDIIVLEDNSKDELGQLTQHYNLMVQRIQTQMNEIEQFEDKRKQLLSNLSHDLRTPLTMILGYAETIRNGLYKDERDLQISAKIILQRSRYMDRLLDQLLDITSEKNRALDIKLIKHNLPEILRKIIADYLLLLDEQHYVIDVDIADSDIEIRIDAKLIERAIHNLIDNALRYGNEGNYLGIILKEEHDTVSITIKDKGMGIPHDQHEQIFERFYRVNPGRNGEGLGLGLPIVKEIVALHHGSVQVISSRYGETSFIIKLPKK